MGGSKKSNIVVRERQLFLNMIVFIRESKSFHDNIRLQDNNRQNNRSDKLSIKAEDNGWAKVEKKCDF